MPGLWVKMDKDQFKQIIWNLLLNASEAIETQGEIRIETFVIKPKRVGIRMGDQDVFVNVIGGMQIDSRGFLLYAEITLDGTGFGMGKRSQRYAMIVEDGTVTALNVEEGPGVEVSSAETMMALL